MSGILYILIAAAGAILLLDIAIIRTGTRARHDREDLDG